MRTVLTSASLLVLALAPPASSQVGDVGLSAVRAQRFGHDDLGEIEPQLGDSFGFALAAGDFNGDGADDLATGIPFDDGSTTMPVLDCGGVAVRPGVPGGGLAPGVATLFLRQTPGLDPAEVGDLYGYALAACDFDGDGYDDLAVGVAEESVPGAQAAGAVQVHYGSASGLRGEGDQFFGEGPAGVPGNPETADRFGSALACGDFDDDGFAELAVGVPGQNVEGSADAGAVRIVRGSASGLLPTLASSFDLGDAGVPGDPGSNENLGLALATGRFDGDSFADLAVGVPFEAGSGAVLVLLGSVAGLTASGSELFDEGSLGGVPEVGDLFGAALAVGDFDGDGFDDLAVGEPGEDAAGSAISNVGQVGIVHGGAGGVDLARSQLWSEDSVHFPGASEQEDLFGEALAAGDFDGDGRADLAIGHPGEFLLVPYDGAVTLLMGSSEGLDPTRRRGIGRGIDGFPGPADQDERFFANALATGDFDGDGHDDLALGAPGADEGGIEGVGDEVVLYGSLFSDGFGAGTTAAWTSANP